MYISFITLDYFGFYCNPVVLAIEWLQNKYHITRTFGYESMFATSGISTFEVAGSFAGRLPIKCDPHWLRQAETTNENREARLPRPPGSKLGQGRLSITSKIFVQQDSNLRNQASCWFGAC